MRKPSRRAVTSTVPEGTPARRNSPRSSVVARSCVPLIPTAAPTSASPVSAVTVPTTIAADCAAISLGATTTALKIKAVSNRARVWLAKIRCDVQASWRNLIALTREDDGSRLLDRLATNIRLGVETDNPGNGDGVSDTCPTPRPYLPYDNLTYSRPPCACPGAERSCSRRARSAHPRFR